MKILQIALTLLLTFLMAGAMVFLVASLLVFGMVFELVSRNKLPALLALAAIIAMAAALLVLS